MKRKVFNRKNIDISKAKIKNYLDASTNSKQRLSEIQNQISDLVDSEQGQKRLDCYIYIMSALVHHQKFGGLKSSQIDKFTQIAEAILISEQLYAGESKLSFLYVELYALLSQIDRQAGEHWQSAWKFMNSFYVQNSATHIENAWKEYGMGIRLMRLGHTELARDKFFMARDNFNDTNSQKLVLLNLMRCLKLLKDEKEWEDCARDLQSVLGEKDEALKIELNWEKMCNTAISKSNCSDLIKAVNKRPSAYRDPSYAIEAYFWSKCFQPIEASNVAKPSSIVKRGKISSQSLKHFLRAAQNLEKCLNQDYRRGNRLVFAGKLTDVASKVTSIERELLILVAATRFYRAEKLANLEFICGERYKTLSYQVSGKKTSDVFSVLTS